MCHHATPAFPRSLTLTPFLQALVDSPLSANLESPKPSPFLRFPTELLDEIFRLSYQSEPLDPSVPNYARMPPHAHRPLCRRLYPSQRRVLYSHVELYSYRALRSFSRALKSPANAGTAESVRSLSFGAMWGSTNRAPRQTVVSLDDVQDRATTTDQDESDEPQKLVTPQRFCDLFARLANLEVLCFSTLDHELLAVLPEDKSTPAKLSRVEVLELSLNGGFDVPDYEGDCAWFVQLSLFPRLKHLTISKLDFGELVEPQMALPALASLTRLSITSGDLAGWSELNLSEVTPNLVDLRLEHYFASAWFEPILRTAPSKLRRLEVAVVDAESDPWPNAQLNEVLRRFDCLEYLSLCEDAFEPATLAACLHPLNDLHELRFDFGTVTTDELLSEIVDGPSRVPHLRRLVIDHVQCTRGVTMEQLGGRLGLPPPKCASEAHLRRPMRPPEWFEPLFPRGCSEAGIRAVVDAAQARGIVVSGDALEALGWHEDYEAERPARALVWCDECCEYGYARVILGVGFVALRIFRTWRRDQRGE